MAVDYIVVIASVIACAAFGWILWWTYGRIRSSVARALIAVGTACFAYFAYFLVQIVGEDLFPAARGANGHIIAYDVHVFTLALVVVVVAILLLRKGPGRAEKS